MNSQRVPGKHIYHQQERENGARYNECKGTQKERETREGARCACPSAGVDCIGMHLAGQWENVCNLTSIVWQIGLHLLNQLKHPLLNTHTHTHTHTHTQTHTHTHTQIQRNRFAHARTLLTRILYGTGLYDADFTLDIKSLKFINMNIEQENDRFGFEMWLLNIFKFFRSVFEFWIWSLKTWILGNFTSKKTTKTKNVLLVSKFNVNAFYV